MTARKWFGRFLADGQAGLQDKSSRPEKWPRAIEPQVALAIVELRRRLCLQAQIASCLGVSKATVSCVLKRAGLSRLSDLRPPEPVQRYWPSGTLAKGTITLPVIGMKRAAGSDTPPT